MLTFNFKGTDGIIKKIHETVGDRPVYLSIDVIDRLPQNDVNVSYPFFCFIDRSTLLTQHLRQQQGHQKRVAGQPESLEQSSVDSMAFISFQPTLSKLHLRMTLMQNSLPWPQQTFVILSPLKDQAEILPFSVQVLFEVLGVMAKTPLGVRKSAAMLD